MKQKNSFRLSKTAQATSLDIIIRLRIVYLGIYAHITDIIIRLNLLHRS